MRGTKAKRIRREHQDTGAHTKARSYSKLDSGQILADRDRRTYQLRKKGAK